MKLFKRRNAERFPSRVTVHTIIDGTHRAVTMRVDDLRQIRMFDTSITCLDRIDHISLTKNMVILQKSSPAYRKNAWTRNKNYSPNYAEYNYVDAYDYNGNHLWNIAEILGDIGCGVHSGQVCDTTWLIEDSKNAYIDGHELFVCWSFHEMRYMIDLTEREVIHKLFTRW